VRVSWLGHLPKPLDGVARYTRTPQEQNKKQGISGQMVKNGSCKKLLQFSLQEWKWDVGMVDQRK